MVNKYIKTMIEFIEDAKDEKLMSFIGLGSARSAIVKDGNYRIDMQKLTSTNPQYYNLQIQVNDSPEWQTLSKLVRTTGGGLKLLKSRPTMATLFVDRTSKPSVEEVRAAWMDLITRWEVDIDKKGMLQKDERPATKKSPEQFTSFMKGTPTAPGSDGDDDDDDDSDDEPLPPSKTFKPKKSNWGKKR